MCIAQCNIVYYRALLYINEHYCIYYSRIIYNYIIAVTVFGLESSIVHLYTLTTSSYKP